MTLLYVCPPRSLSEHVGVRHFAALQSCWVSRNFKWCLTQNVKLQVKFEMLTVEMMTVMWQLKWIFLLKQAANTHLPLPLPPPASCLGPTQEESWADMAAVGGEGVVNVCHLNTNVPLWMSTTFPSFLFLCFPPSLLSFSPQVFSPFFISFPSPFYSRSLHPPTSHSYPRLPSTQLTFTHTPVTFVQFSPPTVSMSALSQIVINQEVSILKCFVHPYSLLYQYQGYN